MLPTMSDILDSDDSKGLYTLDKIFIAHLRGVRGQNWINMVHVIVE